MTAGLSGDAAVSTEAQFLRFRDLDLERARVLAGATAPSLSAIPLGRCVYVENEALLDGALRSVSPDSLVQRLDAGDMLIYAGGQTLRLSPLYVPEVLPFVSGAAYEVDVPRAGLPEFSQQAALVSALGGEDVGRFDVEVAVPRVPRLVALDGAEPALATLSRDHLEVRWTREGQVPEGVAVVVTFAARAGLSLAEVRCHAPDTGRFVIPRRALAAVPGAAPSENGSGQEGVPVTVAIERSMKTPFVAAGLDAGEVVVTARGAAPAYLY